ncbi:hypothetical protein VTN02DRAFT_4897 [Thermoascus thermophilus]
MSLSCPLSPFGQELVLVRRALLSPPGKRCVSPGRIARDAVIMPGCMAAVLGLTAPTELPGSPEHPSADESRHALLRYCDMTQSATLTRRETWSLLALVGASLGVIVNTFQGDGEPLIASVALSGIAYAATFSLIRWLGPVFMKAGLKGKDMAKPRKPEM